jgi:hypothetical protein
VGATEDAIAGTSGVVEWAFRYDVLDSSRMLLGTLDGVRSGRVDYNRLGDIHRTGQFVFTDPVVLPSGAPVNFASDLLRPVAILTVPDVGQVEFNLGVFLMSSSTRQATPDGSVVRVVDGYDQRAALLGDKVTTRYTVASGTVVTTAVESLLSGFTTNITTSATGTPRAMDWDPGTSKQRIIDDLLALLNYEPVHFDSSGTAVCRPYVDPGSRAPVWVYAAGAVSILGQDTAVELDLFDVPNSWLLVVSNPDQSVLTASYTNTNPASATSTASRGRTITDYRTGVEAANQGALDAMLARVVFEASQLVETVTFTGGFNPLHGHGDTVRVTDPSLGVDTVYAERAWSLTLTAGVPMMHTARRVVAT